MITVLRVGGKATAKLAANVLVQMYGVLAATCQIIQCDATCPARRRHLVAAVVVRWPGCCVAEGRYSNMLQQYCGVTLNDLASLVLASVFVVIYLSYGGCTEVWKNVFYFIWLKARMEECKVLSGCVSECNITLSCQSSTDRHRSCLVTSTHTCQCILNDAGGCAVSCSCTKQPAKARHVARCRKAGRPFPLFTISAARQSGCTHAGPPAGEPRPCGGRTVASSAPESTCSCSWATRRPRLRVGRSYRRYAHAGAREARAAV